MKKANKPVLINQLQEAAKHLNHIPTITWWHANHTKFGYYSWKPFKNHFGSWNNAMDAAFGVVNSRAPIVVNCKQCDATFLKQHAQIKRTKRNFCSQSCAAIFNNKNKTHGTRRSKIEVWLEEQLTLLYPDLDIHFNRNDIIGAELDIYFPSLKLAIEINGIFHYKPIFGNKKLKQTQKTDRNKALMCEARQITLHSIDISKMEHFSPEESQKYLDMIVAFLGSSVTKAHS